jgi:RNA polymerase sigma-70 factor (ECF subfamily)
MLEGVSDEELMLRYRDGEAGAFDALYQRHKGPVFRYLRRQIRDGAVAEELFQDVWIRLINARHDYVVKARFTTWLYTIAHNRVLDHVRTRGRAELTSIDDALETVVAFAAPDPPPERTLERKELAGRLLAAIDSLPAAQREAFLLQQEGGLSVEEIAQATGVERETAKSRLRYALAKLRDALKDLS